VLGRPVYSWHIRQTSQDVFADINEHVLLKHAIDYSTTLKGRFFNFVGHINTIYLLIKLFICVRNITFLLSSKVDTVSNIIQKTIQWCFFLPPDAVNVALWSQVISFLLISITAFTSFRGFLIQITKTFHAVSNQVSSGVVILLLAEVMGVYFVSAVLMTRMSLPLAYRQIITQVLGDLEFHFYYHFSDVIFLVSSLVTLLLFLFQRKR
jgi:hypothetical protein